MAADWQIASVVSSSNCNYHDQMKVICRMRVFHRHVGVYRKHRHSQRILLTEGGATQ